MMLLRLRFLAVLVWSVSVTEVVAQCCAGGGGSCIAGGASQGVLKSGEVELNTNFQFISTDRFYEKDARAEEGSFDSFSSTYEYFRLAYGLSNRLTMSVESGYYLQKKEVGLDGNPATTYTSHGVGDLILFPRYDIVNYLGKKAFTEVTAGLGYKIPLGSYNDSSSNIEPFSGREYFVTKPQAVQLSSGAQDIIFYTFLFHERNASQFKYFANAMYILKGYNPIGEKLGDYFSVGIFAGKSFFNFLGITLQARFEQVGRMVINENMLLYGRPSTYFPEATGYKKVFISPKLSYSRSNFTIYVSTDLPVYQYINSAEHYTQAGSKNTHTVGLSYHFGMRKKSMREVKAGMYYCPMCPDVVSDSLTTCPHCGMDLILKK